MGDGSIDSGCPKKAIDHENRKGGAYERAAGQSEGTRRAKSEAMKAFHRKTGKGTLIGNARLIRARKPR